MTPPTTPCEESPLGSCHQRGTFDLQSIVKTNGNQGKAADVGHSANRRCQIGLPEQCKGATNPFPWMSEVLDLKKEKNFLETRVTEYQTGGALSWD